VSPAPPSSGDARPRAPGPGTAPHGSPGDGDGAEAAHEHGERLGDTRREDALVGTSAHTPSADRRPEEPAEELAASADTEGSVD
jgi:hypothetical protein